MNCLQNNCTCANQRGNLVYLTKVFFDGQENSSPIMTSLTTKPGAFTQQLSIGNAVNSTNCGTDVYKRQMDDRKIALQFEPYQSLHLSP